MASDVNVVLFCFVFQINLLETHTVRTKQSENASENVHCDRAHGPCLKETTTESTDIGL